MSRPHPVSLPWYLLNGREMSDNGWQLLRRSKYFQVSVKLGPNLFLEMNIFESLIFMAILSSKAPIFQILKGILGG